MYSLRMIISQPLRFFLTIGGIGLCIVLMLFLLGIYRGVADGSVDYIRKNNADLWVLQRNTTNILRGTSILSTAHGYVIKDNQDIENVSTVLLLLSTIKKGDFRITVFLTGYDTKAELGGPPHIIEGRNIRNDNEIVLDNSFALKYNFNIGDKIQIKDDSLQITGLSSGTNAFVIQYAFVTLKRAQSVIGFPNLVTCYLIKLKPGVNSNRIIKVIQDDLPGVVAYDHAVFLENNIKEMESGFLPLLYAIAVIGAFVLTIILSLILSINILEKRKDFAVMKTLGSPTGFLPRMIIEQALLISLVSTIVGLIIYFPMAELTEYLSPEISIITTIIQIGIVCFAACMTSLVSSIISIQKLRKIYPLEAFV